MADSQEEIVRLLKEQLKTQRELNQEATDYRNTIRDNEALFKRISSQRLEALEKERSALLDTIEAQKKSNEEGGFKAIGGLAALREQEKQLVKLTKAIEDETAAFEKLNKSIIKTQAEVMDLVQVYGRHETINVDMIARMGDLMTALGTVGGAFQLGKVAAAGFFNTLVALAFEVDETSSSLMKQTGITRELSDSIIISQRETARLGVSVEQQGQAFTALFNTYTDFVFQSESVQQEITKTTAVLDKLGISNQDVARGVQNTTKFFGQTGTAAAATARDLAGFASTIGVAPRQLASDFANAGNSLAKFGSDGVDAFKDLAIASKITGIEINRLLQVTDKFDTFEGAATQAGKLNAALGGNFVNAMDLMMTTDPVARFSMIRDSILDTGMSFDDMSYFQRKFFAEAAGLNDVGELAKLMSGNFDDLAGATQMSAKDYADLEARAKDLQSIQEELKNTLRSLVPVIRPLLEEFRSIAKAITENEAALESIKFAFNVIGQAALFLATHLGKIVVVLGTITALKFGSSLIQMGTGVNFFAKGVGAAQGKVRGFLSNTKLFGRFFKDTEAGTETAAQGFSAQADASERLSRTGQQAANAIREMGEASGDAAANLAKLAKPILAIGLAVGAAAFGVSFLVKAFGELEGAQIAGAVLGIIALGVALALFAKVALVAAVPATGLAGAILAIGAAVGIAAVGLSFMIQSFAGLGDQSTGIMSMASAITVLTAAVLTLGTLGLFAAPGLALVVVGITGLSSAMADINAQPLADFTTNLSNLTNNIAGLRLVKEEIVAISNAMKGVPKAEIVAISNAMKDIPAFSGASIGNVAALATNFNAAPTNVSFKPEQTFVLEIDGEQFRTKIKNVQGEEVLAKMHQK